MSAKPKRIQRKRTKGWKMPPNTVYVGRPTTYGNPWKVDDPPGNQPCHADVLLEIANRESSEASK